MRKNILRQFLSYIAIEAIDAAERCFSGAERENSNTKSDATDLAKGLNRHELNRRVAETVMAEDSDAAV